jgi:hypothetical protein
LDRLESRTVGPVTARPVPAVVVDEYLRGRNSKGRRGSDQQSDDRAYERRYGGAP